jgi:DNA uptake protein ComE-like DNA-binding protein
MKDTLRDLFTFTAGERKGIIVLIMVVILISGYNLFLTRRHPVARLEENPSWMNDSGIPDKPAGEDMIHKRPIQELRPGVASDGYERSYLDPNDASYEELRRFGFTSVVSRTILKYRARGGKFKSQDDLRKIYGLDSSQYASLSERIKISPVQEPSGDLISAKAAGNMLLDINHADSALFEKLPGIGPVLAKRIIRYRSLLGGFYTPLQIKEVYGISDSLYLRLENMLVADSTGLKKIDLNTATEKEMAGHPYLGRYVASGIVRYRIRVTRINSINELKINGLLSEEAFNKIKKYLSI